MLSLRDQLADRLDANLTVENCCAIFAAAGRFYCDNSNIEYHPHLLSMHIL